MINSIQLHKMKLSVLFVVSRHHTYAYSLERAPVYWGRLAMLAGTLYPPGPGDNVSLTGSRCADVPNANVGARYLCGLPPS